MSASDSLEKGRLAPTVDALQHGPRPLPLFLHIAQQYTSGDAAKMQQVLAGLRRFQQADRAPPPPSPPVLASAGSARLLDYGGDGPPIVFIPSLINPSGVLDLMDDHSLLRWLSSRGFRPLLVDWGYPDQHSRAFNIDNYISQLLHPLLRNIEAPYHLAGYCLGGTMALASACLQPPESLTLIATPWNFSGYPADARTALSQLWERAAPVTSTLGLAPMELFQAAFWTLDPARSVQKYIQFLSMDPASPKAQRFIRIEDWANSGAPLSRLAAEQLITAMFSRNETGKNLWRIDDIMIDPASIACPVHQFISLTDRIVPSATAPDIGTQTETRLGHVGMIVGSGAQKAIWEPLANWVSQLHKR